MIGKMFFSLTSPYHGDRMDMVKYLYGIWKEKVFLKQMLFTALIMLLFLGITCSGSAEDMPVMDWEPETARIPLDAEHFPDDTFRSDLQMFDEDGDGMLSEAERTAVSEIDVSERGITSLAGLVYFPELVALRCYSNQLTELDVSCNTKLEVLYCDGNHLTGLDLAHNPELADLICYENQITELDLSENTKLVSVNCITNALTKLDVSHNPQLVVLYCDNNKLTELTVAGNPMLAQISCSDNRLFELDISQNPMLEELFCAHNYINSIDVSNNPKLEYFACHGNQLTELDVSHNPVLQYLHCEENQLSSLDLSRNALLEVLYCDSNKLTWLDISHCWTLHTVWSIGNSLESIDISNCTNLLKIVESGRMSVDADDTVVSFILEMDDGSDMSIVIDASTSLVTPSPEPTPARIGKPVINVGGTTVQYDGIPYITDSNLIVSWNAEGEVESYTIYVESQSGERQNLGTTTETSRTVKTQSLPAGLYTVYVGAMPVGGDEEDMQWNSLCFGILEPIEPTEALEIANDGPITGSSDAETIQQLQMKLYSLGLLSVDGLEPGVLDYKTLRAVADFQSRMNEEYGTGLTVIDPDDPVCFIDEATIRALFGT